MKRAVFLDRDGTINFEKEYLYQAEHFEFIPGVLEAIRLLNQAGILVVVVTNQSGVARGLYTEDFVREAHRYIDQRLKDAGARVDAFYYCPHHPDGSVAALRTECECRKPKPGQLIRAAEEHDIDLTKSFIVGDRWKDIEAGEAVAARGILVRTGYGRDQEETHESRGAMVVDNLIQAVSWILRQP